MLLKTLLRGKDFETELLNKKRCTRDTQLIRNFFFFSLGMRHCKDLALPPSLLKQINKQTKNTHTKKTQKPKTNFKNK